MLSKLHLYYIANKFYYIDHYYIFLNNLYMKYINTYLEKINFFKKKKQILIYEDMNLVDYLKDMDETFHPHLIDAAKDEGFGIMPKKKFTIRKRT